MSIPNLAISGTQKFLLYSNGKLKGNIHQFQSGPFNGNEIDGGGAVADSIVFKIAFECIY